MRDRRGGVTGGGETLQLESIEIHGEIFKGVALTGGVAVAEQTFVLEVMTTVLQLVFHKSRAGIKFVIPVAGGIVQSGIWHVALSGVIRDAPKKEVHP